jgi:hypothetical protein
VGYKGQRIFVVPDKNLVAVFTADLIFRNGLLPNKLLENYIIPAAVSSGSLPANPIENKSGNQAQVRHQSLPNRHRVAVEQQIQTDIGGGLGLQGRCLCLSGHPPHG